MLYNTVLLAVYMSVNLWQIFLQLVWYPYNPAPAALGIKKW